MRRALRAAVALVFFLEVLTSCGKASSQASSLQDVHVEGGLGAPVKISLPTTHLPSHLTSTILIHGKGSAVHAGSPVLVRTTSFDSRSGDVISEYNTGRTKLTTADARGLGDLAAHVVGVAEGSRVLVARPGLTGQGEGSEIVVVDILYTSAFGTPGPAAAAVEGVEATVAQSTGVSTTIAPFTPPVGMPGLAIADNGGPVLTRGGGAIPELATARLIDGSGEQVADDSTVALEYVIADSQGQILDTTWNGKGPVVVNLSEVMEGLRLGLVDQKARSRVVVLIPSAQAAGEGDRVAIVDILAVLETLSSAGV